MMKKKKAVIIGGGPAGLIAADVLSTHLDVTIIEKEKNVGQKFLVAGKGGFNLTNSSTGDELKNKYLPKNILNEFLTEFDSNDLRDWFLNMGIKTFIGTSGRVFPEKGTKPVEVLNAIKTKLSNSGVTFLLQHKFSGFKNCKTILVEQKGRELTLEADYFIFALGGASWTKTGSDGRWTKDFEDFGVATKPFQSSNCGVNISWNKNIIKHHTGKPLKNIKVYLDELEKVGEAVITEYGLEGNAVYPVVPGIREQLARNDHAHFFIDFKPFNTLEQLQLKVEKDNLSPKNYADVFKLGTSQMAVIKMFTSKEEFLDPRSFIKKIKHLKIPAVSLRPIEEAISTVGGIPMEEVNSDLSLKKSNNIFIVGEMLDWDAPTGGFLLQGCFSTGYFAAASILRRENIKGNK
ncbi:MAG: TIGR03862 family flavoprotein [Ignavibacteriae bacterium]|nr:TIGR03862 family flavoprotein [Ignavibacteriota bacterium]